MHDLLEALNRAFAALPGRLLRIRRAVWALSLIAAVGMAAGLGRLEIDMTMESFLFEDDPVRRLHDRFKETFGSDEGVYIVYEALDGDVLSPASLAAVRGIEQVLMRGDEQVNEEDARQLEHILEVTTIANASYLEVSGDSLISRDFVEQIPRDPPSREALRAVALAHHDYPRFYISDDSRYGGIFIRTDLGIESGGSESIEDAFDDIDSGAVEEVLSSSRPIEMEEFGAFAGAITRILSRPGFEGALRFYAVGNPMIMAFFNDFLLVELEGLFTGATLIMVVVLAWLFRSPSGVLWPVAIIGFSTVFTLGSLAWLGIELSSMISVLVILILVAGIADSVHIMSGYLHWRRQGMEHLAALEHVYRKSGLACLLTSVTTALGMLSLAFVRLPPIQYFGVSAAVGVMFAFLFTILLLPLMLDLWPPISARTVTAAGRGQRTRLQQVLRALEPIVERRSVPVLAVFAAVGAVAAYGVSRVEVDTNMIEIIRPGLPIRVAHDVVDRVMGGTQGMEIYLDFGTSDALKDPRVLNAMEALQRWLETEHPEFVVRTDSLVDVVKDTFRSINEEREEMYRIPQEATTLAQTLLLFEMANPEDREQLAPDDYSEARINVRMYNFGSSAYIGFFDEVQARVEETFAPLEADYPGLAAGVTGSLPLLMQMSDYIGRAQLQSFAMVLLVVTVLLLIVFGSLRAGLVAMVPNVYPVLITFGVMGIFEIPLDADTLIIAPLIIGIAVDDTIHFITHYRAFALESGDMRSAIASTISEVGQAITFTSVILVLGFLVLVTSMHQGMAHFGVLIGIAMASALAADLLLLPALLRLFGVGFNVAR